MAAVTTSLWLDESPPEPERVLERDDDADVVVVGAGVAGIATAYFLARAGARVIVLEARTVAEAASGRNAGFLLAGVAENFVAAARRYGDARARRVWRFTRRNQQLVRELVASLGIDCALAWNGSSQIAGDDAEWSEIQESARLLAAEGANVSVKAEDRTAIYAGDGELHPVRYVRGLAGAARALGARIHERTPVTSVSANEARTGVATVRAGAVVLCVNAYAAHLAPVRIRAVRGQMLATAPVARRVFERPAYAHRGYRYWRQRADGRLLVGGWRDVAVDEEVGEEERTTARVQNELARFLRAHTPEASVTHRWAGIMGFSHDALPYVGRLESGVFIDAGFSGHGMAFATATGELIAELTRGGTPTDTDLFTVARP